MGATSCTTPEVAALELAEAGPWTQVVPELGACRKPVAMRVKVEGGEVPDWSVRFTGPSCHGECSERIWGPVDVPIVSTPPTPSAFVPLIEEESRNSTGARLQSEVKRQKR